VDRKSKETQITVSVNVDGKGSSKIKRDRPFNHMLELFAFHGLFDLEINVKRRYECRYSSCE